MMTKITSLLFIAVIIAVVPQTVHATSPDPPDPSKQYNINAAGATFPFPLIDLWRVEYNKQFPNVNLNYQSIGSGGGIKQHIEKTVNFAASDKPLSDSEREKAPGTLHIPESIGGVVIAYNIPEIPNKGLKLTGHVVADIFLGKITKWNDPQIVAINPELTMPDEDIITAHRSDGSGTTFVFTDYLSTVSSEWHDQVGTGKSVPWPGGLAASGNEGVAGIIRTTPYSIGYVELAYAFQTGMTFAYIQNGDGTAFIEPTIDSISDASAGLAEVGLPNAEDNWSHVTMVNAPGQHSYPIASFTYLLVYENIEQTTKSKDEAKTVIHLIYWMITEGQKHSPDLLYVPISDKVAEIGKQGLSKVKYNGETLWQYEGEKPKYEIPNWLRDNARWWADGLITDEDYINGLQYLISKGILKV